MARPPGPVDGDFIDDIGGPRLQAEPGRMGAVLHPDNETQSLDFVNIGKY